MISVVMLTLNKGPFLPLAVASAMESPEVELILVCPDKSDSSYSLFPELIRFYGDRIQIVSELDNSPAEGLNNGMKVVRGEITAVLNGDDFYLPGALDFVSTTFKMDANLDILLGGGLVLDQRTNLIKHVIPGNIRFANRFKNFPGTFTFLHQSMFYRTDTFKNLKFNETNRMNWDTEFLLSMLEMKPKIKVAHNALAVFRLSADNLSSEIQSSKNAVGQNWNMASIFSPKLFALRMISGFLRLSKFIKLISWSVLCQFKREQYRKV